MESHSRMAYLYSPSRSRSRTRGPQPHGILNSKTHARSLRCLSQETIVKMWKACFLRFSAALCGVQGMRWAVSNSHKGPDRSSPAAHSSSIAMGTAIDWDRRRPACVNRCVDTQTRQTSRSSRAKYSHSLHVLSKMVNMYALRISTVVILRN